MAVPIRDRETPIFEERYTHWLVEAPVIAVIVAEHPEGGSIPGVEDVEAISIWFRNHEERVVEGHGTRGPLEPHSPRFRTGGVRNRIGFEHVTG